MNKIAKWLTDTANVLFDDTKNDLRALPKTVRLRQKNSINHQAI